MEFLRAIGPVFNFLLLAGALFFLTRKRIRKLFRDRKERIAEALGRAADAQDHPGRSRPPAIKRSKRSMW